MVKQKFGGYKKLDVWNKSIEFVVLVYSLTKTFPKHEIYGLTSQIRRASVSVASNIAEGQSRNTNKDFIHFLRIAYASCVEIETQVILSERIGYITVQQREEVLQKLGIVIKMTINLIKALENKTTNQKPQTTN